MPTRSSLRTWDRMVEKNYKLSSFKIIMKKGLIIGIFVLVIILIISLILFNSSFIKQSQSSSENLEQSRCINLLTLEEILEVYPNFKGKLYSSDYKTYLGEEIDKDYGIIESCEIIYLEEFEDKDNYRTMRLELFKYESKEKSDSIWQAINEENQKFINQGHMAVENISFEDLEVKGIYSISDILLETNEETIKGGNIKALDLKLGSAVLTISFTNQPSLESLVSKEDLIKLAQIVIKKIK